jgi:hypothetical protein
MLKEVLTAKNLAFETISSMSFNLQFGRTLLVYVVYL